MLPRSRSTLPPAAQPSAHQEPVAADAPRSTEASAGDAHGDARPGPMLCGHSRRSVSWLSKGTGFCSKCATVRAAQAMNSPPARSWRKAWESRYLSARTASRPTTEARPARREVPWGEVRRLLETMTQG